MMVGMLLKLGKQKIAEFFKTRIKSPQPNDYIPLYNNLGAASPSETSGPSSAGGHRLGIEASSPRSGANSDPDRPGKIPDVYDSKTSKPHHEADDDDDLRWTSRIGVWIRWLTIGLSIVFVGFLCSLWLVPAAPVRSDPAGTLRADSQHDPDCDPFLQPGYLNYDPDHVLENNWVPYEPRCTPVNLLKLLMDDIQNFSRNAVDHQSSQARTLPWLVNRTVVLIGDSIDRFHARDFCDIISATTQPPFHPISENGFTPSQSTNQTPSQSFYVTSSSSLKPGRWYFDPKDHQAVPAEWPADDRQNYLDHHEEWADRDNIRTSPWICEVPSYGLRIITLFSFGIEPYKAGWYYTKDDWYISPSRLIDRFEHILVPLLAKLAKERAAPQVVRPDLIEVSSGLWDIRQWSEEDARVAGVGLDDTTELVYRPLSAGRLGWWRARVLALLLALDRAFPAPATILWRSLHHTLKDPVAPFSRVHQLDQFARFLLRSLHNRTDSPRLARRLKLDPWGRLMLGQQNHYRDRVHPKAVPGSVLWGEIMLWELKQSVLRNQGHAG